MKFPRFDFKNNNSGLKKKKDMFLTCFSSKLLRNILRMRVRSTVKFIVLFLCPSAVRFGRIPKREKQRMLLEMQSAMNNMMNNSQLHGSSPPASNSQTQPCPANLASGAAPHAAPSFSPASSPQSSQSELSSDPEPALPMDTSPSSDSSSATDSGEEEVAGTGTRPGRKAEHIMEDTQEVWNHHNNLATVTHQLPRLRCTPQNPHTVEEEDSLSRCPVRMSNSASSGQCHVQLLANADPTYPCSASVIGQSPGAHNSNGTRANGCYAASAWSGGNRMHLVSTSDLNLNDPSQFFSKDTQTFLQQGWHYSVN